MLTHWAMRQNILLHLILITSERLDMKLKEKGLVDKSNISNLVKNYDLNTSLQHQQQKHN